MDAINIKLNFDPLLFGSGMRLIEEPGGGHVQLETTGVIEIKEAIHLRCRVIKQETRPCWLIGWLR
jgi:hypothetical protein